MIDSMYQKMRVGVVHFKAFPGIESGEGPIVETLEKICTDDFWTAVEVGWMKDFRVRNTARHLLDQSHLAVAYATQPRILSNRLNLNSFDDKERGAAINAVKNCVDEAYDLGAEVVRIIAGKDPGDAKRAEAKKLLVDSIQQVLEYGKEEGQMKFTLKIFDRDIDKMNLIGHFVDALDIAKALRPSYPNFGLLADLSHFPLLKEKAEDSIPLIKDYLESAHLGNCVCADRSHPAYGDIQPRFGMAGGEIGLQEVMNFFHVLMDNGFFDRGERPIVSAEVRPVLAGEISEIILANAKRVMRDAWALANASAASRDSSETREQMSVFRGRRIQAAE
jgi:sugar phosphate isomerase/epimerase